MGKHNWKFKNYRNRTIWRSLKFQTSSSKVKLELVSVTQHMKCSNIKCNKSVKLNSSVPDPALNHKDCNSCGDEHSNSIVHHVRHRTESISGWQEYN